MGELLITADTVLSTEQIAKLLGVAKQSVANWCDKGRLVATRTAGGHRRITASSLVALLKANGSPLPKELAHLRSKRVLIVDDDEAELRTMSRLLGRYADSLEVFIANNGMEALVLIGDRKPDLIVLDIVMPGMDGFEFVRRLRQIRLTKHIKVLMTTGYLLPEFEEQAAAVGVDRCYQKPVPLKLILDMLGIPHMATLTSGQEHH